MSNIPTAAGVFLTHVVVCLGLWLAYLISI